MIRSLLVSLILLAGASAVPLRVVTFNIEANRGSNGFVTDSLNDPGTMDYDTVRDILARINACLLYTSPSPRDKRQSRMPSSA